MLEVNTTIPSLGAFCTIWLSSSYVSNRSSQMIFVFWIWAEKTTTSDEIIKTQFLKKYPKKPNPLSPIINRSIIFSIIANYHQYSTGRSQVHF